MPDPSEDRPAPPPGSAEEALRRLEARLDRASEAAERLMAQAAEAAAGNPSGGNPSGGNPSGGNPSGGNPSGGNPSGGNLSGGNPSAGNPSGGDPGEPVKPPPAGWQIPEDARAGAAPELDPFVALVQALRDLVPPELQRRLVAALRELLLALRALIDWYLEHLERRRGQAVEVQDIPIL
jgi:hypothetical protein